MSYFKKFPIIEYQGNFCRNLLSRVKVDTDKTSMHAYTLKNQDKRADIVADKYYNDSSLDWLVLLSNAVVDPYYDLGLDELNFQNFIVSKYGSSDNAVNTILYYRNNWRDDDSIITISAYIALPVESKKYWKEIRDYNDQVSSYQRKQEDWQVDTNMIQGLSVVSHSYIPGNRITQNTASGVVQAANSTYLVVKSITNTFVTDSQILSINTIAQSIPNGQTMYWAIVNAYDHEKDINDLKKSINLVDNRYVDRVEKQIEDLLK